MKKSTTSTESLIENINDLPVRKQIRLLAAISGVSVKTLIDHILCDWMEVTGAIRLEDAVAKADRRTLETIAERIHALRLEEWFVAGSAPARTVRQQQVALGLG